MAEKEKVDMPKWIRCWEKAGSAMEQTRRNDLGRIDVHLAIEAPYSKLRGMRSLLQFKLKSETN